MDRHLHIVSLDVPYPPDYGGVFEMFFKLKYLQRLGVRIHLHCFEYGRAQQPILNRYCESVHYYKRRTGHSGFSLKYPYIVSSRSSEQLLDVLSRDEHPILFEGIHSTWYLHADHQSGRRTILRTHNVEQDYYDQMASLTRSPLHKLYFHFESHLLKSYEREVARKADLVLCISDKDLSTYRNRLGVEQAMLLPSFIGWDYPYCEAGRGSFCLYHGNLSVPENEQAAIWLLDDIFNDLEVPLIVAGKQPSRRLKRAIARNKLAHLVENPQENDMQDLIRKAHINVLPSFSTTGVKFKLLNSIFCGRHCIANEKMLESTHLGSACEIANDVHEFKYHVARLMMQPFTTDDIDKRGRLLKDHYDNTRHAEDLVDWIW